MQGAKLRSGNAPCRRQPRRGRKRQRESPNHRSWIRLRRGARFHFDEPCISSRTVFSARPGHVRTGKNKNPRQFVPWNSGLVGAEGFEPSAFCSRSKRATRLRYAPTWLKTKHIISYPLRRNQVHLEKYTESNSGQCDPMVVRPNAEAAKTLAPQCDLSPIWNLWRGRRPRPLISSASFCTRARRRARTSAPPPAPAG